MNKAIRIRQQKEREVLLKHLKKTPIIQIACERAGIGRATYYRWKKGDSEFAREAEKALRDGVSLMNDFAESQLISSIRDKNMTAIIYWLKHRHIAYSTKLEITGSIETTQKLTKEQQELFRKAVSLVIGKGKTNE